MNLLCPGCQRMLQVAEQFAGQRMRCPLCNYIFQVPPLPETPLASALTPPVQSQTTGDTFPPPLPTPPEPESDPLPVTLPPVPPAPPPSAESTAYVLADDPIPLPPPPPPPPLYEEPPLSPPPPERPRHSPSPKFEAAAPPVVGDYRHARSLTLDPKVLPWIAPIALGVLFFLMLLPWISVGPYLPALKALGGEGEIPGTNAWSLGFGRIGSALFVIYDLLVVLAVLAGAATLLMHLRVIPDLPQLRPIEPYKLFIVAGLTVVPFLLLLLHNMVNLCEYGFIPYNLTGTLAFWAHATASVTILLEIWVQRRGTSEPLPSITLHW